MKEKFPEFHFPKKEDFKQLWQEAIFVLDTNVLLSLYSYPPKIQVKLLTALKKLKKRLWIPHQVALEFYRRRLKVIYAQEKSYENLLEGLVNFENEYNKHPFLQDKKVIQSIKIACNNIRSEIGKLDSTRPKWLVDDSVLVNVEKLIGDKVGEPYDTARTEEIFKEGGERYSKDIPPGYKDIDKDKQDKSKTRKFGDLLVWYQIIDKALAEKKPIIFVTDDQKEDWWWKEDGGRNIGARYELKKEMLEKTGMKLHMYQSDQFILHTQEHLNTKFSAEFMTDIRRAREALIKQTVDSESASSSSSSLDASLNSVYPVENFADTATGSTGPGGPMQSDETVTPQLGTGDISENQEIL